jgi:hypothetical protein
MCKLLIMCVYVKRIYFSILTEKRWSRQQQLISIHQGKSPRRQRRSAGAKGSKRMRAKGQMVGLGPLVRVMLTLLLLVGSHMLLQVVLAPESFRASGQRTAERAKPGVDAPVPRQLFVTRKAFPASRV